jgi:hypothetical protein
MKYHQLLLIAMSGDKQTKKVCKRARNKPRK